MYFRSPKKYIISLDFRTQEKLIFSFNLCIHSKKKLFFYQKYIILSIFSLPSLSLNPNLFIFPLSFPPLVSISIFFPPSISIFIFFKLLSLRLQRILVGFRRFFWATWLGLVPHLLQIVILRRLRLEQILLDNFISYSFFRDFGLN